MTGYEALLWAAFTVLLAAAELGRRRQNVHLAMIESLQKELDRTREHVAYIHTRLREGGGNWQ